MFDLSVNSAKNSAKLGLAVTLLAVLAACSHKQIQNDGVAAELNPIPANEIVQSTDAAPTPVPMAKDAVTPKANKKSRGISKFKFRRRTMIAAASHKARHKKQATAAVAQVSKASPPPSAPPASTAALQVPPPPVQDMTGDGASSSSHGWAIWALIATLAGALVVAYHRSTNKRKSRRLVFNH